MSCKRLNDTSAASAGGGGGVSDSCAASAGGGGGGWRHSAAPAGGGGGGDTSPKNSNICLTNHHLVTNIRCYKDRDELPDDTYVFMYERFVPTFVFSNKIISRKAKTHGDDWYHNVGNLNQNDLE